MKFNVSTNGRRWLVGLMMLLAMTLLPGLTGQAQAASDVTLVRNGQAVGGIYVSPPDANNPDAKALDQAASELQEHIKIMSGATLEIHKLAKVGDKTGPGIIIGSTAVKMGAVPQKKVDSLEGFRTITQNNQVLIGGQSDQAVLMGSYELLRQLGCDWVMPGKIGQIVPHKTTVTVKATDVSQAPDLLMRRLYYRGFRPRIKADFARMTVWTDRMMGGHWRSPALGAAGHNWQTLVRQNKKLFAEHPEMLALVRGPDGKLVRKGPQIETTDPRITQLYIDKITSTYKKNIASGKWTKDTPAAFPMGPADGMGYSLSSESAAAGSGRMDPIIGEPDRTDEMILLANKILDVVNKTYPNAMVGYYSYSAHANYPMRYQPNPNIVQIFAPINFSRFHGALDDISKTQHYYRNIVEQWGKLHKKQGNVLIYRGYNWNLADNMLPYSKLRTWGEEIPWYVKLGFQGMTIEGTKAWSINGPSDYVLMRLAWDSSQDWHKLLHEYCVAAYGPAAAPMEKYWRDLTKTQHDAGQEAGSYHAFNLIYDDAFVKTAQNDIAKALSLTKDKDTRTRIGYVAHSIEALQIYLDYHKATVAFDFPKAKALYNDMLTHWQKGYDENHDIVANETPGYLKRFLSKFVDQAVEYSTGQYKMVYQIPDELITVFDPEAVGNQLNLQSPKIVDKGFIRTKTITTTWDAQGLSTIRDGAAWYRIHFKLPASAKGKPIGLFIGGFDDEARVWINGKVVGTSGRRFSAPAAFDLTDGIDYDHENLLAIQIVRNSKANEIGTGGILRPSFLFTGPQLKEKAPKPLELRRILPGGGIE